MKATTVNVVPAFKPIELLITIESEHDKATLATALQHYWNRHASTVQREALGPIIEALRA